MQADRLGQESVTSGRERLAPSLGLADSAMIAAGVPISAARIRLMQATSSGGDSDRLSRTGRRLAPSRGAAPASPSSD
jgi:hypothetical protein